MKLKALFLALAVAGAGASFALAGGSTASDTTTATTTVATTTTTSTTTTADGCRHFELHGTLATVSPTAFSVTVTKGNHAAKPAVGSAVTVAVAPTTRVSWSGAGTLTGPNVGDSVKVNGKLCGTVYTASKVQARSPKAENTESGSDKNGKSDDEHGKKSH